MARTRSAAVPSLARAAPVFAALGDDTRLAIVARLSAEGPQSTVRLTEGSKVTRQAVAKHLQALADAGLVRGTREGRERIWEIRTRRLAEVRAYLDQIADRWDEAIVRLRRLVEDDEPSD